MIAKEIITKSVIGKGKKTTNELYTLDMNNIDNVLGCWVINHNFYGRIVNDKIEVSGEYDVNIWYSFDNNTKTSVIIKKFNYKDNYHVRLKNNTSLTPSSEVIVKVLDQPNVTDVNIEDGHIKLSIVKQLGIEVIGEELVKVNVIDDDMDYEEIIDEDIDENYLK